MKKGRLQDSQEGLAQVANVGIITQVADRLTHQLPDVFLRVEVRGAGREVEPIQAGMVVDKVLCRALMPGGTVPQEQEGAVGEAGQHMLQEMDRGVTVEMWSGQGDLLPAGRGEHRARRRNARTRAAG